MRQCCVPRRREAACPGNTRVVLGTSRSGAGGRLVMDEYRILSRARRFKSAPRGPAGVANCDTECLPARACVCRREARGMKRGAACGHVSETLVYGTRTTTLTARAFDRALQEENRQGRIRMCSYVYEGLLFRPLFFRLPAA